MFRAEFRTSGNAAFSDGPIEETARILEKIAARLRDGVTAGAVYDINGGKVGKFEFDAHAESEES